MQRQHRQWRDAIEQEQHLSLACRPHAGGDEKRSEQERDDPSGPKATPGERNAGEEMAPPIPAHLVCDNGADDRIEPAVLIDETITQAAAGMKETDACVIDEAVHRILAVDVIEGKLAQAGDTIRKRREEL